MARIVYRDPWGKHTIVEHEVSEMLFSKRSEFQQIDVFETERFGTILALGGVVNVSEVDEMGYHEMLAHVPLLTHPNPRRVLIIGGGDGGTMREVTKHESVQEAVQVEIDEIVVNACKQYLPETACGFDHPKANLIIGDGLDYVKNAPAGSFDVILVDSTDPVDAGTVLFTEEFYHHCHRALADDGILVPQSDTMIFSQDNVERVVTTLSSIFASVDLYTTQVPTYPGSLWNFCYASKGANPLAVDLDRATRLPDLRYYTPELHRAAFVLPKWAAELVDGWKAAGRR